MPTFSGQGGRLTHNVARHVNNVHPETVDLTRKLMATLPEPLSGELTQTSESILRHLKINTRKKVFRVRGSRFFHSTLACFQPVPLKIP